MAERLFAGGTLAQGMLYVRRPADDELPEALRAGEFCYVFAPRQMGKSSLRARAEAALREDGVRCVTVDLSLIGSRVSPSQWYFSLLEEIAEGLGLEGDVSAFWARHEELSAVLRVMRYLRDVVLREVPGQVVIFIDEIDSVLALPGLGDDFFAAVRSLYNLRADDAEWRRLTFCLLGVAVPGDLIADPERTPFNIGRPIRLLDFTPEEAQAFLPGLGEGNADPAALLREVYEWTSGHPYMTHKLCSALEGAGVEVGQARARVAESVRALFLRGGRAEEPNLAAADRFFRDGRKGPRAQQVAALYRRLLDGEIIAIDRADPVQLQLRLTGIAAEREEEGRALLRVRNRIFAEVFNQDWLAEVELSSSGIMSRPNFDLPAALLGRVTPSRAPEGERREERRDGWEPVGEGGEEAPARQERSSPPGLMPLPAQLQEALAEHLDPVQISGSLRPIVVSGLTAPRRSRWVVGTLAAALALGGIGVFALVEGMGQRSRLASPGKVEPVASWPAAEAPDLLDEPRAVSVPAPDMGLSGQIRPVGLGPHPRLPKRPLPRAERRSSGELTNEDVQLFP